MMISVSTKIIPIPSENTISPRDHLKMHAQSCFAFYVIRCESKRKLNVVGTA